MSRPDLGDIKANVPKIFVIFGPTKFFECFSKDVNQIPRLFAIHGNTFFDIIYHGCGRKLKCLKGGNFV